MNVKKMAFTALFLLIFSSICLAGECGVGKVLVIMDGGWNENSLFIKLDSYAATQHPGTYRAGEWIGFSGSALEAARYNGIKAIALAALTSNKTVRVYTAGTSCESATELSIFQ